nr:Aminoacyl tRNA synthase complex-interacting multifunctional protein 1 [Polyrhizophydium stewartii]
MSAVAPGSAALAAAGAQPGANADANAHTLGVGAGMTGGAGAVSFADPSDAGKLEAEIPDELKEYPPPESIASLDKQMDALLEDIKILLDARNKEFQISGESRTRMPLLPPISKFETFKTTRKDNLESILKVEIPSRKIGASEVIQKGYWNIERYFEGDRLLDMLLCFYKEKAERLLQENRLLMSRWSRFCRTSFDISRFYPTFYKRNERLRIEFSDAATRYERLFEIHQARVQKRRAEMAAEEAARIDAERRGLAVLKNKTGLASSRKVERAEDKDERNVFSGIMDELSFFGPPELGQDPGFDVEDLAIYMRWLISIDKERRDLSLYLIRSKLILHKERNDLLEDYRFLDELKSGDEIVDSLEYFDNLNAYIDQPPIKTPRVEDLIAEYDLLVSHWDVETPINQEDGRPFAYEIDHKFFNNFAEQSLQFSLAPYEAIQVGSDPGDASAREGPAQHSGNSGLDELTNSLANLSGYTQKSNTKSTRFPKLRRATWLDSITLVPEFDESQAAYRRIVAQLVDTDMELRIEHDMLLSSDHEAVGVQLKEIAKRVWERAASEPNCKPHAVKISIIPQQREYKPPVDTETRQPHMFDLGMAVSEIKSDSLSSNILASKKKDYGLILKSNEENRKLEMELLNADPMRNIESSEVIQHEVFAYLQMRFIKIRELRVKLLRQFNYLRVIEKRLNLDMAVLAGQRLSETQVSAEAIIAKIRAEFLDMGSQGDEGRDKQPEPSESADLKGYASMETSSIVHGMIQVCDAKGTPFVYDVALADMEAFDTEMMHIVTLYINESRPDDHINPEYLDELRFRMSNRRTEMLNVTYLNPFADRSQIMLEFYEAHFAYQNAKIELLNSYLEGYEHVTDITNAKELAHIITNIVHLKPLLNLQESYFGRSYAQSTKALELHSQLVVKCIRHEFWDMMADNKFQLSQRTRRQIGGLDSNLWLQNPYLPDALLSEYYVPYDQTDEGTYKSLGVQLSAQSFFNDASFQANGREILFRGLKVVVLRSRLLRTWIESENWRKAYEAQFSQMGVPKANFANRLGPLRFDAGNANSSSFEEAAEAKDAEEDIGALNDNLNDSETDLDSAAIDTGLFRLGPLAISELDELQSLIDVSNLPGITSLMRPTGILRLKQSIRIQLLEKNWLMAATELHNLLLSEIHGATLNGQQAPSTDKNQSQRPTVASATGADLPNNNLFDVDYRTLATTNLGKKKQLRRILMAEFSKEYKSLSSQDITENQKEQAIIKFKDGGSEVDRQRYKQSVQTQEIVCNDAGAGAERLAKLWYLPHLTEIVLTMGGPDKPHKGAIDLSHRIFRNPQIFLKSAKIHSLIFEIYSIVSVFAHLLQDNRRYAASVKQLREADYVVSTMNLIKRDLLNQGEPADYTRVHNFLAAKWQFWFLKLKYAISSSINVLEMNMFNADRAILASHYAKCITKKFTYLRNPKRGKHEKPLSGSKAAFVVTRTFIPTSHVFGSLSPQAKRLCDSKVQEIDESIEEHFQLIQYNGSDEDMNKSLSDFLTFNIKLLALRREYFALLTGGQPIKNETMQAKIFQKYKMRIIVPSLRQYHKTGSKGTILLQDEIITGEGSLEINRVARGAFDRCQLVVLQNEIMRDYSAKMVRSAQEYFDKLTDERLGRLFRGSDTAGVNSPSDAPEFAFRISEEDYNIKMSIFNTFLSDLHHSSVEFLQDLKDKQTMAPTVKSGRHAQKADDPQLSAIFDDKKIFACNKEFLGRAWKTDCVTEQEGFVGALYGHLLNTIRNFEQIILFQAQEKREMAIVSLCLKINFLRLMDAHNFRRESRLMAHEIALETFSEMASMSVELNEMRKSRKIDERKLRNKIIDEYDDLVQELTKEIGVLRHRFREYQIGNLNDVMNIMAEAKKEQLIVMTQNEELPLGMREAAEAMIQHEEQLASLREQNHELKMTVLKIRSMFTMKEQALKCYYERKLRKLSDANKEAEEKLWDNYRDAEARERTLRKQLTKLQKAKSTIEFQNELLQRQLREEQTKPRTNQTLKAGATAAQIAERSPSKGRGRSEAKSQKLTELEDRLRRYEGINIDNLIQELANKTALLEEMIQEKRDSAASKPLSARDRETVELNSHMVDKMQELLRENKALRRKLFLNGIPLPPESRNVPYLRLGQSTPRHDSGVATTAKNSTFAMSLTLSVHSKDVLLRIVAALSAPKLALAVEASAEQTGLATLRTKGGQTIQGPVSVAKYLLSQSGRTALLGASDEDAAQVDDWTHRFLSLTAPALKQDRQAALTQLNDLLAPRVFVVGSELTLADLGLYATLYNTAFQFSERLKIPNVIRFYDLIQHRVHAWQLKTDIRLVEFDLTVPFVPKPAAPADAKAKDAKGKDAKGKGKEPAEAAPTAADGAAADKGKKGKDAKADKPAAPAAAEPAKSAGGSSQGKKDKPAAAAAAAGSAADASLPDPSKLDIRVGTIVSVKRHPDADTLYVEEVDLGEDAPRTVVSGLVKYMTEDKLQDRKVVLLCNLKPAKMRGIESQAMVLATTSADGATVELLDPPAGSANGDIAYFDGYKGTPEKQLNSKKKVWESIQPNLQTDQKRQATYVVPDGSKRVCVLRTDRGVCTVKTVAGGSIK